MAMEKQDFRDNVERLSACFPGKELIPLRDAAAFLGCDHRTLLKADRFPLKILGGKRRMYYVPLVSLARWLSV